MWRALRCSSREIFLAVIPELASADQSFARPDWVGREVTDAQRYYNLALAARSFADWSDVERNADDMRA